MIRRTVALALFAAPLLAVGCRSAEETAATPSAPDSPMAGMSEEEMTSMMMEMATPGPAHEILASMVGTFDAEVTSTMAPGAEPEVSAGTLVNEMILGGRFLSGDYTGSMMGGPFSGLSITGFNNGTQEYQGFWIDSFGTLMMPLSHGTYDAATKTITMHRSMSDPVFGTMKMREVITIEGPDRHVFEMYSDQGAGEYRNLRIVYTRR